MVSIGRGVFYMLGQLMLALGILVMFLVVAFAFLMFARMPVNQLHLWKLEQDFYRDNAIHPRESFLLQKKSYIGGPYDHGSLNCGVFVGELRAAPLTKEEIRYAYTGRFVASLFNSRSTPLSVLFFDEGEWPVYLPLTLWWDEWNKSPLIATSNTAFFVYASREEYPSWGDPRCDD